MFFHSILFSCFLFLFMSKAPLQHSSTDRYSAPDSSSVLSCDTYRVKLWMPTSPKAVPVSLSLSLLKCILAIKLFKIKKITSPSFNEMSYLVILVDFYRAPRCCFKPFFHYYDVVVQGAPPGFFTTPSILLWLKCVQLWRE